MAETYGKRSAVFRTGIAESGKKHYHRKKRGTSLWEERTERRKNEPILI